MRTYYFKIRDKFIANVRSGIKCHEYRLASPENRAIKVGDIGTDPEGNIQSLSAIFQIPP